MSGAAWRESSDDVPNRRSSRKDKDVTLKSVPSHPRDREANLAGLLQQLDAGESALLLSAAADIALVINPVSDCAGERNEPPRVR